MHSVAPVDGKHRHVVVEEQLFLVVPDDHHHIGVSLEQGFLQCYEAFLAGFELGFKLLYGQSCCDGRVGRG